MKQNDTSEHNLSTVSMSHYLSSRIIHSYEKPAEFYEKLMTVWITEGYINKSEASFVSTESWTNQKIIFYNI